MTDGVVEACPECDRAAVQRRVPNGGPGPDYVGEGEYRCNKCGARFDEPVVRQSESNQAVNGAAKLLADMEPEEFERDVLGKEAAE